MPCFSPTQRPALGPNRDVEIMFHMKHWLGSSLTWQVSSPRARCPRVPAPSYSTRLSAWLCVEVACSIGRRSPVCITPLRSTWNNAALAAMPNVSVDTGIRPQRPHPSCPRRTRTGRRAADSAEPCHDGQPRVDSRSPGHRNRTPAPGMRCAFHVKHVKCRRVHVTPGVRSHTARRSAPT